MRIGLSRVAWEGLQRISKATVVNLAVLLPNPTRLIDKSIAGKTIVLSCVLVSFLLPSGIHLLLVEEYVMTGMNSWSAKMSIIFRLTFISSLTSRCFVVECKVRLVLTYLKNPILATRWVSNLSKVTQVRSG